MICPTNLPYPDSLLFLPATLFLAISRTLNLHATRWSFVNFLAALGMKNLVVLRLKCRIASDSTSVHWQNITLEHFCAPTWLAKDIFKERQLRKANKSHIIKIRINKNLADVFQKFWQNFTLTERKAIFHVGEWAVQSDEDVCLLQLLHWPARQKWPGSLSNF